MPVSIRKYPSKANLFAKYISDDFKQCKSYIKHRCEIRANTSTGEPRSPNLIYNPPTSLWRRFIVPLTGSAARRDRACARLNTFVVGADEADNKMAVVLQDAALKKFIHVYDKSGKESRQDMLNNLDRPAQQLVNAQLKKLGKSVA